MAKIPVALQLYSVREDCTRDLPSTLEAVTNMGYEGVEFAGYYGRSVEELRNMLDDLGLKVVGTHIQIGTLLGDELKKTVESNKTLGNRFLIVPALPKERMISKATWLETARLMNEIAGKVKPEGMRVGYHNHWVEFQPIEEEMPFDIFFGATVPDVVMQFDTGNAMRGGANREGLLEIVKRYPGRVVTVHLKEYSSKKEGVVIGEGEVEWKRFFKICETIGGTKWYIVEQETCAYPPLECVRRSLNNLRGMLQ